MLELTVQAGDRARTGSLVTASVAREALPAAVLQTGLALLRPLDSGAAPIAAQYDAKAGGMLFLAGDLPAGARRRFALVEEADAETVWRAAPYPVLLEPKLDRLVFRVAGEAWATYNVQGARKPYFWPVLGPAGSSVVRGQGTGEHPHHTGMGVLYGGHSEGGSANIWSDWDEPPYGPGGRMLHRGFRRLTSGPVCGEAEQDLTYVDATGDVIAEEVRTIRCWWASPDARYLDFRCDVLRCADRGPRPFLFMIRLPGWLDIPETGKVTNAAGHPVPAPKEMGRYYRAAWVDGSGPSSDSPPPPPPAPPETLVDMPGAPRRKEGPGTGPWNGIALFDHPENDGFPGTVGKYAVPRQITQVHYPPANAPDGPFTFRQRVYVHAGDAEAADVAGRAADYSVPCDVMVRRD